MMSSSACQAGGAAAAAAARSSVLAGEENCNDDDANEHERVAARGSPAGPEQGNYLPDGSIHAPNAESRGDGFRKYTTTLATWTNDGDGMDVEEWGGAVGDTRGVVAVNSWSDLAHDQVAWDGRTLPEVNEVLTNIEEYPEDFFNIPSAIPAELHSSPLVLEYMKAVSRHNLYGGEKKESFKENVVIPLNAALEAVVAEFRRGVPCAACGNVGISTQRICGGCGQIRYCSEACCAQHFSVHEGECDGMHINGDEVEQGDVQHREVVIELQRQRPACHLLKKFCAKRKELGVYPSVLALLDLSATFVVLQNSPHLWENNEQSGNESVDVSIVVASSRSSQLTVPSDGKAPVDEATRLMQAPEWTLRQNEASTTNGRWLSRKPSHPSHPRATLLKFGDAGDGWKLTYRSALALKLKTEREARLLASEVAEERSDLPADEQNDFGMDGGSETAGVTLGPEDECLTDDKSGTEANEEAFSNDNDGSDDVDEDFNDSNDGGAKRKRKRKRSRMEDSEPKNVLAPRHSTIASNGSRAEKTSSGGKSDRSKPRKKAHATVQQTTLPGAHATGQQTTLPGAHAVGQKASSDEALAATQKAPSNEALAVGQKVPSNEAQEAATGTSKDTCVECEAAASEASEATEEGHVPSGASSNDAPALAHVPSSSASSDDGTAKATALAHITSGASCDDAANVPALAHITSGASSNEATADEELCFEAAGDVEMGDAALDDAREGERRRIVIDNDATELTSDHMKNMLRDTSDIVLRDVPRLAEWGGEEEDEAQGYGGICPALQKLPTERLLARPCIGDDGGLAPELLELWGRNTRRTTGKAGTGLPFRMRGARGAEQRRAAAKKLVEEEEAAKAEDEEKARAPEESMEGRDVEMEEDEMQFGGDVDVDQPPASGSKRRKLSAEVASVESGDDDSGDDLDDMDDSGGAKKRKRATLPTLPRKDYNKLKEELADLIKLHLDEKGLWKEAKGERNRAPPGVKDSILHPFLKECKLTDRGDQFARDLWNRASAMARDGEKVQNQRGVRKVGETTSTFEHTQAAETSAKQCTDDGSAKLYSVLEDGQEAAPAFAAEAIDSEAKRAEFEANVDKLWKAEQKGKRRRKGRKRSAAEQTEEAKQKANLSVKAMDLMESIQPDDDATAEILDAIKNSQSNCADADEHCEMSAVDMINVYATKLQNDPQFQQVPEDAQGNGVKMVSSQICHQQVSVHMLIKMKSKGLARVQEMRDEDGNSYKGIFVAVPAWIILHYCQGQAKFRNGGAGNTKNRDPVDTGGHLQLDILNGTVINTKAAVGEGAYLYEAGGSSKRRFQVLDVTEYQKDTVDMYQVSMPLTNQTLQHHQLVLGTAYFYGMNANLECHAASGGILEGVLEEDESVEEKFCCEVTRQRMDSLIQQGLVLDPSVRCDGDHLLGRISKYMNGIWLVQPVSHRENGIRSWVRIKWGEWLFPTHVGEYTDGNATPETIEERV